MTEKQWFVFYTKSRQEKKVRELLDRAGFEVFLPLHKVMRQWSDRKKGVEVPLFNSYIFVYDFEYKIPDILKVPGIAWNIKQNGKPAILRNRELELIQRFLATGYFLETASGNSENMKSGDVAEIVDGPLAGITGQVTGDQNTIRFNVVLDSINQVIRVQIPAHLLKKA